MESACAGRRHHGWQAAGSVAWVAHEGVCAAPAGQSRAHHAQFWGMPSCRVYGHVRAPMPSEMELVDPSRMVLSYRKPLSFSTCIVGSQSEPTGLLGKH